MGDSTTTTTSSRISNSQVTPWQEVEGRVERHKSIKDWSIQKRNALRARYTYGIIFLLQNLIAWFVRDYGQNFSPQLQYIKSCGSEGRNCIHTVGVLRVSLGCFVSFMQLV
ncbi:uncharacterized protein LOC124915536 [Impatiens glandulifera]|uniref:uncharacterized protein LOC124915536 n=1 Tax=Impatiens glandulifera TaxID=253017 RepID=UPI001FB0E16D|nr:uncharacterized protein LOC124915536 [Impatiens glandulifera]